MAYVAHTLKHRLFICSVLLCYIFQIATVKLRFITDCRHVSLRNVFIDLIIKSISFVSLIYRIHFKF